MAGDAPWLALAGVALATSALSAVVGMAGGMLLLTAMLLYLEPLVVIPLHGAVQLASNASRAHLQRAHVRWKLVGRFAWLLLPAGALGLLLAQRTPPELGRLGIGVFVLLATWTPRAFRVVAGHQTGRSFLAAGAVVGFANVLVGATGPLLAPFVLSLELPRQGVIGTLAACQTLGHLAKLALFGLAGFAFGDYAWPLAGLCGAALAGSALGTRLLSRIGERHFRLAIRLVLTALALRLVWRGLAQA